MRKQIVLIVIGVVLIVILNGIMSIPESPDEEVKFEDLVSIGLSSWGPNNIPSEELIINKTGDIKYTKLNYDYIIELEQLIPVYCNKSDVISEPELRGIFTFIIARDFFSMDNRYTLGRNFCWEGPRVTIWVETANERKSIFIKGVWTDELIEILYKLMEVISNLNFDKELDKFDFISTNEIWLKENSPYLIEKNTIIEKNANLIIKPGTEIIIEKDVNLIVLGTITAIGTEEEPIIFSTNVSDTNYSHNGNLFFEGASSDDEVVVENVIFENDCWIETNFASPTISGNVFRNSRRAIYSLYSNPDISNNYFCNLSSDTIFIIDCEPGGIAHIYDNYFLNCTSDCIRLQDKGNAVVKRNVIENSSGGIVTEFSGIIANNIIQNCYSGLLILYSSLNISIENNTFKQNDNGIYLAGLKGRIEIKNNSIINNKQWGIYVSATNIEVKDSKILNSSNYDFYLRRNTYVKLVDTEYDKNKVYVDKTSKLDTGTHDGGLSNSLLCGISLLIILIIILGLIIKKSMFFHRS